MSEVEVFPVPQAWAERAHMDAKAYEAARARVERDPEGGLRDLVVAKL